MKTMTAIKQTECIKRKATGLACILYPLLAGFAFATHPNLLSLSLEKTTASRIAAFHGNQLMHFGHLMMGLGSMLLIVIALELMKSLRTKSPWTSLAGGTLAICGAVILSMDKAALCFVPSALDSLGEDQFRALLPGLIALFDYRGYLGILRLLPLLPVGFLILGIGLVKSRAVPRWEAIPILAGAILMCNPDMDLIGLIATAVLALGLWAHGIRLWKTAP
jgi:hypothetical protein